MPKPHHRVTLVRYWSSFLKSDRHGRRIAGYFEAARAAGWRNILVASRPPADAAWAAPLSASGVEVIYHPRARGNFDAACIGRVFRLCRSVGCDILHCDNNHTSPLIGAALAGVPARAWTKHAMEPASEAGRAETWRDRLAPSLRLSCGLAGKVLAVSQGVRHELLRKGIDPARVDVLLLPLDEAPPARASADGAVARAALGLDPDALVVTAVGRAAAVKGWDVLVEAFAAVPDSRARLLLVGHAETEPAFRARLDRLIAEHRLEQRVRFAGHVTDMASVLAATDLFVLPSRSEGHALALVEALRAGLPVAASRVGAASDVIRHMDNGVLFERENVADLASLLRTLASDSPLRARLGAAARAVEGIPTAAEHAAALQRVYESLLARRR